jgi:hypothetical protein
MKKITRMLLHSLCMAVLSMFFYTHSYAQSLIGPMPILNMTTSIAAAGKGNTELATTPDASSGFQNHSKSAWLLNDERSQETMLGISYKNFAGARLTAIALTHVQENGLNVFAGFRQLKSVSEQAAFKYGNSYNDIVMDCGIATSLNDSRWSVALTGRVINSSMVTTLAQVDNKYQYATSNSLSGDISFSFNGKDEDNRGVAYGMALRNVGIPLSYDGSAAMKVYMPADIGAGVAYTWVSQKHASFELSMDAHKSLAFKNKYAVNGVSSPNMPQPNYTLGCGAEYTYPLGNVQKNALVLRGGWIMDGMNGLYSGVTAGAGIKILKARIDVAYFSTPGISNSPYGNMLQLGTSFQF